MGFASGEVVHGQTVGPLRLTAEMKAMHISQGLSGGDAKSHANCDAMKKLRIRLKSALK